MEKSRFIASSIRRRYPAITICVLILAVAMFAKMAYVRIDPTARLFQDSRSKLDRVIASIKATPIDVGSVRWIHASKSLDPASVVDGRKRELTVDEYSFYVNRYSKSGYLIEFVVQDMGHFGSRGLIYCDNIENLETRPGGDLMVFEGGLFDRRLNSLGGGWWYGSDDRS